jgi:hypothetical protein
MAGGRIDEQILEVAHRRRRPGIGVDDRVQEAGDPADHALAGVQQPVSRGVGRLWRCRHPGRF